MTAEIEPEAVGKLAALLVRHPSEQSEAMESDPAVLGLIDKVVGPWLQRTGLSAERDGMGNLMVDLVAPSEGPHLMIVGYAMTHPRGAMPRPFDGDIIAVDGANALRGRGVSEQKGPLAAALSALQAFARKGGPASGRLTFALVTAGETGRHDAAASVLAHLGSVPDFAVIALGTDSRVAIGNKGRIDVDITVHGRSCHSSTPWQGVDAVAGARAAMDRLDDLRIAERPAPERFGPRALTVTAIESFPKATHTVQDRVALTVDRRLLPGDDPDEALAEIRQAIGDLPPWTVEIALGPVMYPALVDESCDLVRVIRQAISAEDSALDTFFSPAALDAGYFLTKGSQAVMWGPGKMEQFHSSEEAVALDDLARGARGYLGLMRRLLGTRELGHKTC